LIYSNLTSYSDYYFPSNKKICIEIEQDTLETFYFVSIPQTIEIVVNDSCKVEIDRVYGNLKYW